jgi:hypothetical protein
VDLPYAIEVQYLTLTSAGTNDGVAA